MFRPENRICYAAFLIDFSVMMAMTAMPFFVFRQVGGSVAVVGAFSAGQAIGYAVLCFASIAFVARAANGLVWARIGLLMCALPFSFFPFFRDPFICGSVFAVSLAGLALVWPALHSWVGSDPDPGARARLMARFNIGWSFGFAVSPLVAGPLYDYDYRLPFFFLTGTGLAALWLVWHLPHEHHQFGGRPVLAAERVDTHRQHSESHLYATWAAVVAGSGMAGIVRSVYAERIDLLVNGGELRVFFERDALRILTSGAATKFSWICFVLAFSTALTFHVMGRTRWWQYRFWFLAGMQMASACGLWVLAGTRSLAVMFVCMIVIGVTLGATFFSSVFYGTVDPRYKHRRMAVNEFVIGLGVFLWSLAYGFLGKRYGVEFPLRLSPLIMAPVLVIEYGLLLLGRMRARRVNGACA